MTGETHTGTVKWFRRSKNYGFIVPEKGGEDVFVHVSAVEEAGIGELLTGQRIEYRLMPDKKKRAVAGRLKLIEA
ncbi:MAG: cold-shock protein [Parvibaculum sp.]|nr:cold-shock protein [Parvibaculum sp.]